MILRLLNVMAVVFLIFLSRVCLSQIGASSDNFQFIKHRIDTLNFYANQTIQLDWRLAKDYADQALSLAEKIHYSQGQADACEMIGMSYGGSGEFDKSLNMFVRYIGIEKQLGNIDGEIRGNLRISAIYIEIRNFERAAQYLGNALILANKSGSDKNLGWVYYYFGLYYYEMKDTTEAMNATLKSYDYFRKLNDPEMLGRSEKLVGDISVEMGRLDEAIQAYNQAIRRLSEPNLIHEKGNILTRIAHVYQLKGDLPAVLKFNFQALQLRESLGHLILLSHSLVNIGKTYFLMGQSDSALYYLRRGLQTAIESDNNYVIQNAYYQLSSLYASLGNYRAAMDYGQLYFESFKKYSEERTRSEIYSSEVKSQLQDIESQNQLLKQELEIQTLELQNRSYSELITQLIIVVIGALFLILAYIIERNRLGKSKLETINTQLNKEVEERILTEAQLRNSEELYRFVTEHTLDLIVRMDRNFRYLYISPSILRMFGYSPADNENIPPIRDLIPENFQAELKVKYLEMIRTREPVLLANQLRRKDGSLFWSESHVNPIFDVKTGKLMETITVIRDITDRVTYEESLSENARQKGVLLREIHHRVKNNFAILISLMNMQKISSNPVDFKDFLTELQGRIRTMSLVHELLYRSHDLDYIHFGEYLDQLVSIISRAYKNKPVKVHSSIGICILDVESALPLGLISNEILTNAFKYAIADRLDGELWIELKRLTEEADTERVYTHSLTIRDNGPGLPDGYATENQKSMGSQIITLLVDQLEGRLKFSGEGGATFTVYFSDEKRS